MCYSIFAKPNLGKDTCNGIILKISGDEETGFLNKKAVEDILTTNKVNPVGRPLKDIKLSSIEKALRKSQYIDSVECYTTAGGQLAIDIKQRFPIMFIIASNDTTGGYYIDCNGKTIPNSCYPSNVLVATGDITPQYAKTKLVPFGNYLIEDKFWNNQIEQVHVTLDEQKKPVVLLVQRVGEQNIFLGPIDDYKKKLSRLRAFYEKALPTIGWNKYTRFNLMYPNQVLCKRKKVKHT